MCNSHEHEHDHAHAEQGACCGGSCGCTHEVDAEAFTAQGMQLLAVADGFLQEEQTDDAQVILAAAKLLFTRAQSIESEAGVWLLTTTGLIAHQKGQLHAAEQAFRQGYETAVKVHGENFPGTAIVLGNLGDVLALIGKTDEAIETLQNAVGLLSEVTPQAGFTAEVIESERADKLALLQQLGG
jgi:hypothetical protein